jgi:hypothetical protein
MLLAPKRRTVARNPCLRHLVAAVVLLACASLGLSELGLCIQSLELNKSAASIR